MNKPQASDYLSISEEVQAALDNSQPVVALESTIISHGMPWPKNVETALQVEDTVRRNGSVPATIGILQGQLCVGLTSRQIECIGKAGQSAIKVSRRDLPFILQDQSLVGATTVAATMIIASMAGIRVFATGGVGGVHRGAEKTMDISADLCELGQTGVAVVCAGAKSILDIGLTREYLETQGVPVIGFQTDVWPAFYTRRTEYPVDYRLDTTGSVAAVLKCKFDIGLKGGAMVCVPVPKAYAMPEKIMDSAIAQALKEMDQRGITGKQTTPFLLERIAEITGGDSLETNIQLVLNNATVAAGIAAVL